jgi:hypothetical protein
MFKKIILLIFIFLLTGCYDYKELNDIAILTATEINKIDKVGSGSNTKYVLKSED